MRQQQQAAMMAEQAKEKFETEGKLTIGQQGFGHDYALAEQEFGHDMALEAIKQEASSEKSS